MSLYVRLFTKFFVNRKTIRLRAIIGDAGLWLPPRLWCYAAENQPDGDFSGYSAEELAMLLGYTGNATSMLEALQQAGFMDGMHVHDWHEHNGFHKTFSERGKKGAEGRWSKKKNQEKDTDSEIDKERERERERETSNATSIACASDGLKASPVSKKSRASNEEPAWLAPSIPSGYECLLEWYSYKAERRDKYTERGWKSLITQQARFPEHFVKASIEVSVANQWKGLFTDKITEAQAAVHLPKPPLSVFNDEEEDPAIIRMREKINALGDWKDPDADEEPAEEPEFEPHGDDDQRTF